MWLVFKICGYFDRREEHKGCVCDSWENSSQMDSSEKQMGDWGWMGQMGKKFSTEQILEKLTKNEK